MRTDRENKKLMKLLGYVPWDIDYLLEKYPDCNYYVVWSTRKNGKTYGAIEKAIKTYLETGNCSLYLRRYENQITGAGVIDLTSGITANNGIYNLTHFQFDGIQLYKKALYLTKYDEDLDKDVRDEKPFMHLRDISHSETIKGKAIANLQYIFFDEFIPESAVNYVTDEFTQLFSILSTMVGRVPQKDGTFLKTKIFFLGNTLNKYNLYFTKLGMKKAKNQKPNTEVIYQYGDGGPRLCGQYYESKKDPHRAHTIEEEYFSFDCPELSVITGSGTGWTLENFPLIQPGLVQASEKKFDYFIRYDNETFHGRILQHGRDIFTTITIKTTPIKNPDQDLIYDCQVDFSRNICHNLLKPRTRIEKIIYNLFIDRKVFYQDLEVGCAISNYIEQCTRLR